MKAIKKITTILLAVLVITAPIQTSAVYVSSQEVVSTKTPISAEKTDLKWALKLGNSYKDAPSTQIVVDNTLIVMSGNTLYKIDTDTGEIIKSAEMVETPSYSYTSPTYAEGVIYCPLDNATVQAFSYKNLKSLWIYRDELGGQSLTPITYSDGCIYTGFWNNEDMDANYVCIEVKDENIFNQTEEKSAKWTYTSKGGFYWAGAEVYSNAIIFGCDDGTFYDKKPSKLISLDKYSGKVIDTLEITGDQRSGVSIYNGTVYAVAKAGWLYSSKLNSDGSFNDSTVKKLSLGGASTSKPVIYNNRLYVGVQGSGFGKGYLKVIDASTLKLIYSAQTKGYPQNSVLLSDAYVEESGMVYVYATYNANPGGITVFTDKPGQSTATQSELFVPEGDKANYCISSIVSSEDGTLYYKNDSGYIFALENTENEQTEEVSWFVRFFNAIIEFFRNLFK